MAHAHTAQTGCTASSIQRAPLLTCYGHQKAPESHCVDPALHKSPSAAGDEFGSADNCWTTATAGALVAMAFWGVELKPDKVAPFVPPPEAVDGKLHVSQATIAGEAPAGSRAVLKCKVQDGPWLRMCSLREGGTECCGLDLIYDQYTEFVVEGDAGLHLTGYMMPEYGPQQDEDDYEEDPDFSGEDLALGGEPDETTLRRMLHGPPQQQDLALQYMRQRLNGDYEEDSEGSDIELGTDEEESFSDSEDDMRMLAEDEDEEDYDSEDSGDSDFEEDFLPRSSVVIEEINDEAILAAKGVGGIVVSAANTEVIVSHPANESSLDMAQDDTKAEDRAVSSQAAGLADVLTPVAGIDKRVAAQPEAKAKAATGADSQDENEETPPAEPLQAASAERTQAAAPAAAAQLAEKAKQKAEAKQKKKQKEPEAAVGKEDKKRKRAVDGAAAADAVAPKEAAAAAAPGTTASGDAQKPLSKKQRRELKKKEVAAAKAAEAGSEAAVAAAQPEAHGVKAEGAQKGKVQKYENGFIIENMHMGPPAGKMAKPGKKVVVQYVGKLASNGRIFDQTKGNSTFGFRLGVGEVIKGWDRGVQGMRVGDKRKLTVPPQMAYGSTGVKGTIPSNATLQFDVTLKDVK